MADLFEGAGAGKKLGLLLYMYMASGFLLGIAAFFVAETAEMAKAVWGPQAQVPPTEADVAMTGGVGLVVVAALVAALAWSLIVIRRERRRQRGHGADTSGIPAGDTAGDRAW